MRISTHNNCVDIYNSFRNHELSVPKLQPTPAPLLQIHIPQHLLCHKPGDSNGDSYLLMCGDMGSWPEENAHNNSRHLDILMDCSTYTLPPSYNIHTQLMPAILRLTHSSHTEEPPAHPHRTHHSTSTTSQVTTSQITLFFPFESREHQLSSMDGCGTRLGNTHSSNQESESITCNQIPLEPSPTGP